MDFCAVPRIAPEDFPEADEDLGAEAAEGVVVLGGGCFWCVDAVYRQLDGVLIRRASVLAKFSRCSSRLRMTRRS